MNSEQLLDAAKKVLDANKKDDYTIPAEGLYPHQWLWDSCFIAIGLRHYDVERAQKELLSILRGQWSNGMIPHMVFDMSPDHRADRNMWRSWVSAYAPDGVATSGITQPPILAEAIVRIGEKLTKPERRSWYQRVFQALCDYHCWLYTDRDPHAEGLILLLHPWETGLDNTPPWMQELRQHQLAWWIQAAQTMRLDPIINAFRRDTHFVPAAQRLSAIDALALYSVQRRLRRKAYDSNAVLTHSLFAIEDAAYNAILVRANQHLRDIATLIDKPLPPLLIERMPKTEVALEQLWDAYSGMYYSRNFITHKPIKEPTIATLLPLYAGCITKERAEQLVKTLQDAKVFGTKYPIPSTPLSSSWFQEFGYWQGPTWINTNWLIADGLRRYGYTELADGIAHTSLKLTGAHGFFEYFSPLSGKPAGTANFSWTAALAIDFLEQVD